LPKLPDFATGSVAPPVEPFRQHLRRFGDDREMPAEAGVVVGTANGTAFAEAFLEAGKGLRHRVGGAVGFEESRSTMDRPSGTPSPFPGWRYAAVIARSTVGHPWRTAPVPSLRLSALSADVRELDGGWGRFAIEETLAADRPTKAFALVL